MLDGLIQNAGPRFQRAFADEPLLERLRVCGTSELSDPEVRKKCSELFRSWAVEYKSTPGLERIAMLYKVCARSMTKLGACTDVTSNFHDGSKLSLRISPR